MVAQPAPPPSRRRRDHRERAALLGGAARHRSRGAARCPGARRANRRRLRRGRRARPARLARSIASAAAWVWASTQRSKLPPTTSRPPARHRRPPRPHPGEHDLDVDVTGLAERPASPRNSLPGAGSGRASAATREPCLKGSCGARPDRRLERPGRPRARSSNEGRSSGGSASPPLTVRIRISEGWRRRGAAAATGRSAGRPRAARSGGSARVRRRRRHATARLRRRA